MRRRSRFRARPDCSLSTSLRTLAGESTQTPGYVVNGSCAAVAAKTIVTSPAPTATCRLRAPSSAAADSDQEQWNDVEQIAVAYDRVAEADAERRCLEREEGDRDHGKRCERVRVPDPGTRRASPASIRHQESAARARSRSRPHRDGGPPTPRRRRGAGSPPRPSPRRRRGGFRTSPRPRGLPPQRGPRRRTRRVDDARRVPAAAPPSRLRRMTISWARIASGSTTTSTANCVRARPARPSAATASRSCLGLGAAIASWRPRTAHRNAGYAADSVIRKPVSTIHGTRTERPAAASAHGRESTWRPRRYAGKTALTMRNAFSTCAARNASGGESAP